MLTLFGVPGGVTSPDIVKLMSDRASCYTLMIKQSVCHINACNLYFWPRHLPLTLHHAVR